MPLRLETQRLIIRPPSEADLPAYNTIFTDERVMQYVGGVPLTEEEIEARLQRMLAYHESSGYGFFALELKETGQVIGDCGIVPIARSGTDHRDYAQRGPEIEVGYRLGYDFWGKGYATESCVESVRHAFEDRSLQRIIGVTHPDNHASQHVLRKCGLNYIGLTEAYYDTTVSLFDYERSDWLRRCSL